MHAPPSQPACHMTCCPPAAAAWDSAPLLLLTRLLPFAPLPQGMSYANLAGLPQGGWLGVQGPRMAQLLVPACPAALLQAAGAVTEFAIKALSAHICLSSLPHPHPHPHPEYGLYGAFVPCIAYALLGSSRQLVRLPQCVHLNWFECGDSTAVGARPPPAPAAASWGCAHWGAASHALSPAPPPAGGGACGGYIHPACQRLVGCIFGPIRAGACCSRASGHASGPASALLRQRQRPLALPPQPGLTRPCPCAALCLFTAARAGHSRA